MDSDVNRFLVDDVEAAVAKFGLFIGANARFSGLGMEVCKPPIGVNFVKISVSYLH